MAQMGRAKIPRLQFRGRSKVPSANISAMFSGSKTGQPTEKERFSYLKDAYVFAKNNKDLLENSEVQATLLGMIEKAGFAPITEQKPTAGIYGTTPEGTPYAHAPAGRGEQKVDYPATIKSLYERFATEHAELFRPYEKETMQGGLPATERVQPLAPEGMRSEVFQQPRGYAPGTYFPSAFKGGVPTGEGFQVPYPTTETDEVESNWSINKQPNGDYFIEDKTGRGKPTVVKASATTEDKDMKWAIKNALIDLSDAERSGSMAKREPWLARNETDEEYEARRQAYIDERIEWYLNQLGKGTTTEQPTRQPTAVNPKTGERLIWNGKAWVPET